MTHSSFLFTVSIGGGGNDYGHFGDHGFSFLGKPCVCVNTGLCYNSCYKCNIVTFITCFFSEVR